jgi:hypothetical protein
MNTLLMILCAQSVRYKTFVKPTPQMSVSEVEGLHTHLNRKPLSCGFALNATHPRRCDNLVHLQVTEMAQRAKAAGSTRCVESVL